MATKSRRRIRKKKADITVTSGLAGADLVVTYKAPQPDGSFKTGKITIKNAEERTGIRFFQSWKSATSEYLDRYNAGITDMAKIFISKLVAEL